MIFGTFLVIQRALNSFFEADMERVFEVEDVSQEDKSPQTKKKKEDKKPTTDWWVCTFRTEAFQTHVSQKSKDISHLGNSTLSEFYTLTTILCLHPAYHTVPVRVVHAYISNFCPVHWLLYWNADVKYIQCVYNDIPCTFPSIDLTEDSPSSSCTTAVEDDNKLSVISWNVDGLDTVNLAERARGLCSYLVLWAHIF